MAAVMVGDPAVDILAAKANGVPSVGVLWGHAPSPSLWIRVWTNCALLPGSSSLALRKSRPARPAPGSPGPLHVVPAATPASIVSGFALWCERDRPLHPSGDGSHLERGVQVSGVARGGVGGVRGVREAGPHPCR